MRLDVEPEVVDHGRLITCRGARATEERLLADLSRLQAEARADLTLLAKPVRVIVSSRPLREHLAARIARRLDGAALGVVIHTLWSAARQILDETDQRFAAGEPLYEVLVRREAGREPTLRALLEGLSEGYGLVTATVRDFLSAGLRRGQVEELQSHLAALEGPERERALALGRVAARTEQALDDCGARRAGDLLQLAAAALESGARALPSRALLVHGFADATGQATALLRALLRRGARIYLDAPPDPASSQRVDRGVAFSARFRQRLNEAAMSEEEAVTPSAAPRLALLEAAGAEAEVREVAYRIRELLEAGERPESIAVVARDLAPYAVAIRRVLRALAVPFSAGARVGAGGVPAGLFPAHRRLVAVLELLRGGQALIVDRWLDACGAAVLVEHREELRLALRALGATRLREAAALDAAEILQGRGSYPLPSRQGIVELAMSESPVEGEEETVIVQSPRRRLPGAALEAAIAHATALLELLDAWPERAVIADHLARVVELLEHLGWDSAPDAAWRTALDELGAALPARLALRFDELLLLVSRRAESFGVEPLGGEGGGVQVLDVAHARSLTFDHLFVVGLNRDVFPRSVREDPLLPDAVRRCLQRGLPDLSLKRLGSEEERFLFAELCSASPSVTLSWQWTDEEGHPKSPSPLVERLRLSAGLAVQRLPRLWTRVLQPPFAGTERRPRPLSDCLKLVALGGDRSAFAALLPLALRAAEVARTASGAAEVARARLCVLEEQDPDLGTLDGRLRAALPSPYLGLIAPLRSAVAGDPREGSLFVTTLESLSRCPWRTFLTRLLRIEVMPDPLAALPGIAALPIGTTVHRALARIVVEALGRRTTALAAAQRAGASPVGRPPPLELVRVVEQEAAAVASEEGIRLRGLQRVLATMALPFVVRALELDWPTEGSSLAVLGAEVLGEGIVLDVEGRQRRVGFRADRADHLDERLRLSDYKTGRPLSTGRSAETRQSHLVAALARGEWLQGAIYASSGADVVGRYLFLQPDLDVELSALELATDDAAVREVLPRVLRVLLAAWDEGAFVPRLEEVTGREPSTCRYCKVAEACVRGDSSARRRWRNVLLRAAESSSPAVQRAAELWRLGREPAPTEDDE
jgi:superfamily I DNA/RNA helicase